MFIGWRFAGQRPGSAATDDGIDQRRLGLGDNNGNGANVTSKPDWVVGHKTHRTELHRKTYVCARLDPGPGFLQLPGGGGEQKSAGAPTRAGALWHCERSRACRRVYLNMMRVNRRMGMSAVACMRH